MKALLIALIRPALAVALVFGLVIPSFAADRAEASKRADLQLRVDVPPSWRPFLDDDIADALARVVQERFRRQGYQGVIAYIEEGRGAPNPDLPLLTIRLHEWRITRSSFAECTLSSLLRTGGQDIDLGLVTNTEMTWIRDRGRFGLAHAHETADAFEDAASGAMRDLYRRIAETGKVPGLELRRKK
ncbi:MAG: hypothetical protein C0518_03430 [Opitutus sp.]|nr:hypothetical protein [Opitutus sp.]